ESRRIKQEGLVQGLLSIPADYNLLRAISATVNPIDREDVAAGEGAFSILIVLLFSRIMKSSISPPFLSQACARTPAPPGIRSLSCISGNNLCSALVKADLENDL